MSLLGRSSSVALSCAMALVFFGATQQGSSQSNKPKAEFTELPSADCGGPDHIESIGGRVTGVASKQYRLVIYARACDGVFYVQPTVAEPLTNLNYEGKFDADIHLGQTYYVLLVAPGFKPKAEMTEIPEKGGSIVAVFTVRGNKRYQVNRRRPTIIRFAGFDWTIKTSENTKVGPGPNYFSGRDIRVDAAGLHLRAEVRDGRLYCAEIVSIKSFGVGTYRFIIASDAAHLDSNLVLGLFTWSNDPDYNHREIDIELSRWGQPQNDNAQFVVQPYTTPENIMRFMLPGDTGLSIHSFTWLPGEVRFESMAGRFVKQHVMGRHIPEAGGENARINLWSIKNDLAGDGATEVLIKRFEFTPVR